MNCLVSKMGPGERQERKELKEEGHQSLACMLKDIEGRLDQVADAVKDVELERHHWWTEKPVMDGGCWVEVDEGDGGHSCCGIKKDERIRTIFYFFKSGDRQLSDQVIFGS